MLDSTARGPAGAQPLAAPWAVEPGVPNVYPHDRS